MNARSFTCQAIVLKRSSVGETDRILTLLSQEYGKFTVVAKGVRKLSSSRSAVVEPGNYIKAYCINTKTLPLLTQTSLISDTAGARESLQQMKQLHQLLEILDRLFVEIELDMEMFDLILETRELILQNNASLRKIRENLEMLISALGFQTSTEAGFENLSDYISSLTDKKVHSYEFLTPKV